MKNFLWCLLLLASAASAQTSTPKSSDEYDGVAGSPYLFKDWLSGTVYYKNGRVVNQFKLRFDCCRNYLMLEFKGQSFAPQTASITSFVLNTKEGKNADSMVFRKGYPSVENWNEETFYHILLTAKSPVLHILTKSIVEEKGLLPSSTRKFFEDEEHFFLLHDGKMIHLPKDEREQLAALFPAQREALLKFMQDQDLKMKSPADFIKLGKKFNELVP
ncbi:hypothetical protein HHL16_21325 [Pseudoflavitalea sp. G-6-1-2]|uniref:hypothetical protein n=1 Tax=Pseudoflavitalea sp. G-6-1-2 TaxID=2728841 RepID=UPI00146A5172|nr:hypothetical protein [Pseudoflavitalea sp. G-6-1-2]NML23435.1 hypothetical protein [Pseudoflavitalea sp. G-6-1-2]